MRTLQLKTRLAIAGLLLIATTVATGLWSVTAFRRVSQVVSQTVAANEQVTDATTKLASALEREDDALLLVLRGSATASDELAHQHAEAEAALARIADVRVHGDVAAYEKAVAALVSDAHAPDARDRYYEEIHSLLLRAVSTIDDIRDDHFRSSQAVAEWAGVQATRSMQIVTAISAVALMLLGLVVFHFARVVIQPISEMTRAVQAIRKGDFSQRVESRRDDELGRLGAGLSRMADELEEFRRTNIGEVIHAKKTLEATLGAFPDAVLVIDHDRNVSAANPRAQAALPLPEVTRATIDEVLRTGVAPDATVDLTKTIELVMSPNGEKRKLLPRIVPIESGRGVVLVLSDVTELARLDEMRLELVAVASHELRTPLTTMRMTLSMLSEHAARYEARDRDLVSTAMLGVEQLSVLVDEFLDLTRIEAGQLRLQWTRVSLRALVDGAIKAAAATADQVGITVSATHAESLPSSIAADQARLSMVISNLISNALKYTPAGGKIEVSTFATPTHTTVEVSDSGPGVPVEYRERVFERFFRVEQTSAAGVGIGLYIARQVIEAHGGTIRCDSSPLGGARFTVTLPSETAGKIPGQTLVNDPGSSG